MFRLPVVGPVLWQALAVPKMAPGQLTDFVEPARWPDWEARYRVQTQYRGFGRALLSTLGRAVATSWIPSMRASARLGTPTLLIVGACRTAR
jgi:hypothetical protein